MRDPRVVKVAHLIIHHSVSLQPGQRIAITGPAGAAPLIRELYREALRAGGLPSVNANLPGLTNIFFEEAGDEQLRWVSPVLKLFYEEYDALVTIWADDNTRAGANIDRQKQALSGQTYQPLVAKFNARMANGSMKWCGTLFPTNAHAQDAEMSLEEYEDFVFGACLPDPENPLGFWQGVEERQQKLVAYLNQVERIRLVAPETDLTIKLNGRNWVSDSGHLNMPGGEVYTSPVETETEGFVRFTYPGIYMSAAAEDVRLWFERGRVVKATASKGEDFLHSMLDRDEGARRLGEFAIGANPGITRFTGHTLFDEKIQGTTHMALGFAIPEAGGVNQSQIHWDIVCDLRQEGRIYADDILIYENGEFVIDFD